MAAKNFFRESDLAGIGRKHSLGDRHLTRMQRPCAGAAKQKSVAELRLAGGAVGKVAERPKECLDAGGRAGIDHLGNCVVPEILLESRARRTGNFNIGFVGKNFIGEDFVIGMAAADAGRFHRPRCGKIGRAEADAVHAR